jgi:hypothetical protein
VVLEELEWMSELQLVRVVVEVHLAIVLVPVAVWEVESVRDGALVVWMLFVVVVVEEELVTRQLVCVL